MMELSAKMLVVAQRIQEKMKARTQTTGRKKYWFLHDGKKYDFSKH